MEFRGAQVSCDDGLQAMRELDDVLEMPNFATAARCDNRKRMNTAYPFDGMFRPLVFGRLVGYEDANVAGTAMRKFADGRELAAFRRFDRTIHVPHLTMELWLNSPPRVAELRLTSRNILLTQFARKRPYARTSSAFEDYFLVFRKVKAAVFGKTNRS